MNKELEDRIVTQLRGFITTLEACEQLSKKDMSQGISSVKETIMMIKEDK